MNGRRSLAVVALLLALPLFAFPIAAPAPDPETSLRIRVTEFRGDGAPPEELPTYDYENLSAAERDTFDTAVDGRAPSYPLDRAPDRFAALANRDGPNVAFVTKDGERYELRAYTHDPGPDGEAVLVRFGSLVGSILLALGGAYALVVGRV